MKTKICLNDGQVISGKNLELIKDYIFSANNNFFIKDKEFKVNFVGYLQIYSNETNIEIFSFPKEYEIPNENNFDNEFKNIIKTILLSKMNLQGLGESNNIDFDNSILVVSKIIEFYHNFGLYTVVEKEYKKGHAGNINFAKIINKVLPIINNNSLVFNEYINTKKNYVHNYIAEALCYVIETGTRKYNFYFNEININLEFNRNQFANNKNVIKQLHKELAHSFKDQTRYLILLLIDYFSDKSNVTGNAIELCTSNYNLVWEHMITKVLLKDNFNKQSFDIGQSEYGKKTIEIDHFNPENKKIYDSKYYTYNDYNFVSVDYKQLFYHYHVANINHTNGSIFEENKNWENILIKPQKAGVNEQSKIKHLDRSEIDGVVISEMYVVVRQIIEEFLNNNSSKI